MNDRGDDVPAFPGPSFTQGGHPNGHGTGMSLRDWFAGQPDIIGSKLLIDKEAGEALAGPRPEGSLEAFRWQCQVLAALRYMAADAMVAESAKAEGGAA
jgi:hypothetical protein